MMSEEELRGLLSSLEVLGANGFGTMKEEILIIKYIPGEGK
jgi:hypothetical protein